MNRFANVKVKTLRSTINTSGQSEKQVESTVVQIKKRTIWSYAKITFCCIYSTFLITMEYLEIDVIASLREYYNISAPDSVMLNIFYVLAGKLSFILAAIFICELGVRVVLISGCFLTLTGYFSTIFASHLIALYFTYSTLVAMGYSLIKSSIIATCLYTPRRYRLFFFYTVYVPGLTIWKYVSIKIFSEDIRRREEDGSLGEYWRAALMKMTPLFVLGMVLGILLEPLGAKVEYIRRVEELQEKDVRRSILVDRTESLEEIPDDLPLDYQLWKEEHPINFFEILDLKRLLHKPYYLLMINAFLIAPLGVLTKYLLRTMLVMKFANYTGPPASDRPLLTFIEFSSSFVICSVTGFLNDQYINLIMVNAVLFQVVLLILTYLITTSSLGLALFIIVDIQRVILNLSNLTSLICTVDITGWNNLICGYCHLCFSFGLSEVSMLYLFRRYGAVIGARSIFGFCMLSNFLGIVLIFYAGFLLWDEKRTQRLLEEQRLALAQAALSANDDDE